MSNPMEAAAALIEELQEMGELLEEAEVDLFVTELAVEVYEAPTLADAFQLYQP